MIRELCETLVDADKKCFEEDIKLHFGNIYDVNNANNNDFYYPILLCTIGENNIDLAKNTVTYNLTLFYINRDYSYNDKSAFDKYTLQNEQSEQILITFVKYLYDETELNFNTSKLVFFKEKLNDYCSGAYIQLNVVMEMNKCRFLNTNKI